MSNGTAELAQKLSFKWEAQRILILDKDDHFRFMARTMFQRQRTSEVLSTASMAEAVLHLMASPVNACLVGVAENEPAGIEFLRWLRDPKASPCPNVPVAALTESKDPRFIQRVCRFGIEGLLRKPVSQESLTRRISQMITEPKRMVIAPGYLGPDRRAGKEDNGFEGPERRRPSEPVFTDDRPRPAVALNEAPPKPQPAAVKPPVQLPRSEPAARPEPPKAAPPPTPAPAKPPPPPTVPLAASPAAKPVPPPPSMVQAPAPQPKAPPPQVYKPAGTGAKLELNDAATAKPKGTGIETEPPPVPVAAKSVPIPTAPATKPAPAALPPAPQPAEARPEKPPRPKVKPVRLAFDLNGVLDAHRNWVLSRGTEGGRATLSRQNMTGIDLSGAILTQADLTYCRMTGAECSEARLDGADLRYADLAGADLTEAVLGATRLRHVNLQGAVLKGANLRGADLSGADLRGADLDGAQLHGAIMLDTMIHDTDLSSAEGLMQQQINKTRRNGQTKLPPGLRLNLGDGDGQPGTAG